MITEKGQLPVGLEFAGKCHRDYEIRGQKLKDSIDALEDERARKNDAYFGVCLLAKQIVKLGEIPCDAITPELLGELYDEDVRELSQAKERLAKKLAAFRGEDDGV
ncbi:MAG: hypothetical protein A3J24_06415 [Deltaproteobacteria bacterium RIFCSPLOWO2_02_FULL_53_8]|nr:MAG: hypothetical protein A3J24_06415 [Deltaproteobacteria bacterium RIFCSPLOWO2_02_FULL_53_8]